MIDKPLHIKTPILESRPLRFLTGKDVFLKMDCFQPTGSFKTRGIGKLCQYYKSQGKEFIAAASGGNAGFGAAYCARKLGMKATVFMPKTSIRMFIDKIESENATVIIEGNNLDEASKAAQEFLEGKENGGYVSPYNHPKIWEGNSTLVDEVVDQMGRKPDAVIASVGGGGLLVGIIMGMQRHGWNDVPVYGVETQGATAFAQSLAKGEVVTLDSVNTIATSIASKTITPELLRLSKIHPTSALVYSDREAVEAILKFLDEHKVLVEPACAVALVPILKKAKELEDKKCILVEVCGGVGISYLQLTKYLAEVS